MSSRDVLCDKCGRGFSSLSAYHEHRFSCGLTKRVDQTWADAANEGRKDDTGKAPWSLLPFDAIGQVVAVLRFGAGKYAPRNWEKGMAWNRPFDAALRHLTAWHQGEAKDAETGLSHLAHAACCVLFLLAYELRSVGKDTRPQA